jgi:hypothetical protein
MIKELCYPEGMMKTDYRRKRSILGTMVVVVVMVEEIQKVMAVVVATRIAVLKMVRNVGLLKKKTLFAIFFLTTGYSMDSSTTSLRG